MGDPDHDVKTGRAIPVETSADNGATAKRAVQLRRIMNESLRQRTSQERDRMMQVHLAQGRGTTANALLLRQAMNFALRLRARRTEAIPDDG